MSLVALCMSLKAASPTDLEIGIGAGEKNLLTHVAFDGIPKDAKIVRVSTRLVVDKAAPVGLNFFAVQVNYPNKTWAHGGPQLLSGVEKVNWGGLVNRGGGTKDYEEVNWKEDLLLIECGIDKPNTVPWKWDRNVEYTMVIERGKKVHIPAGTNAQFKVTVPERTMWEWILTIKPVVGENEPFSSVLYDSADHISSFYIWNESGYGSFNEQQHTKWSLPSYRIEGSSEDKIPTGWKRF